MFLVRLARALDHHKVPYAIVGGYAVALHGAIRGTVDIDLVLNLSSESFERAEAALESCGLVSRIPVTAQEIIAFRQEYMTKRNLLAWSFYDPKNPALVVDIVLTEDLRKLKTVKKEVAGYPIKVLGVSDLIKMKERSGRPQDLEDARALRQISGRDSR